MFYGLVGFVALSTLVSCFHGDEARLARQREGAGKNAYHQSKKESLHSW